MKFHHRHHGHHEGKVTKAIENQTSKLPSALFLTASFAAMAASVTLHCLKQRKTALFMGQWAAPLMIMGLYNKIVKTNGHD